MPDKPSFKRMNWSACLSHKIFPHIEKGWPDRDVFYWGLAEGNTTEIKLLNSTKTIQCIAFINLAIMYIILFN